jgi:hypothetical protein
MVIGVVVRNEEGSGADTISKRAGGGFSADGDFPQYGTPYRTVHNGCRIGAVFRPPAATPHHPAMNICDHLTDSLQSGQSLSERLTVFLGAALTPSLLVFGPFQ